ncbi:hypothetical protein BKA65DRAFT_511609 [Rhexocercosporidium sp. MPI-PUGE-AT-0058]|nr:hypothetical protein BKA65DRAFT_511609 [Rhexocercosporidium sp. MPI-PUGE-AT-0058]
MLMLMLLLLLSRARLKKTFVVVLAPLPLHVMGWAGRWGSRKVAPRRTPLILYCRWRCETIRLQSSQSVRTLFLDGRSGRCSRK